MNNLLYYLFLFFYYLVKFTPNFIKKPILNFFAWCIWNFDFFRKKVVLKNLEIAFPEKSQNERLKIAKEFYRKFVYYMADIIETLNISKEELYNKIKIVNEKYIQEALSKNRPIVFMTAHFGNWEIVPKYMGAFYIEAVVLMREFDNAKIGEFFKKSRNSFNITTLNKKSSAREIIKAFKNGKSLGVLIDQHSTSKTAIDVEFLGQKVRFNRAISTLAKKFNAIVVPLFSYSENGNFFVEFLAPREFGKNDTIESFTQWQADIISDMIKKHPSEYYWFHKRFKNIRGIYE